MIDNFEHVLPFAPEREDGDTFIYTEMLDRGKRKGNNGARLVKTFYHRSRAELTEQMPTIRALCDLAKVRACTRLAQRSYKKVGREFTRLVVETALSENWAGMKTLYNRALGIVTPNEKLWLFDVDLPTPGIMDEASARFQKALADSGWLVATLPSKKGFHFIGRPYQYEATDHPPWISLHKDNPTNLYIPDGAD